MDNVAAIDNVLQQIRSIKDKLASHTSAPVQSDNAVSFTDTLKNAINSVNDSQMKSIDLKTRFEKGDPAVTLADVMIASQKAGLAFDATVQVRNRMIQAYQDIMNMPI